jgi:hypothetical protein
MNDFSELEAELRKMRPAPVPEELLARIERDLTSPEPVPTAGIVPRQRPRSFWWSLALGLAGATALIMFGIAQFSKAPQPQPKVAQTSTRSAGEQIVRDEASQLNTSPNETRTALQPSRLTRVVYHRRDEGLVFPANKPATPLRRVRYETRDTMQWRDPQTGASLLVSYPAEQVVLSPVSFE